MNLASLILVLTLIGCQDYNSNSVDKQRFSKVNLTGSGDFTPAYYILQQRCTSCHQGYHNAWAAYTKEQDWIDKGYVTKRDPDNSRVIYRIINHGSNDSNMPIGLGPLPNDEYQQLVDWVTNIP